MTHPGELPFGTPDDLAQCYERLLDPREEGVSGVEPVSTPREAESPPVEEPAAPPPLKRIIEALLFVSGAPPKRCAA